MYVRDSACVSFFMSQQGMNYHMPNDLCLNIRASFATGYDLKDTFQYQTTVYLQRKTAVTVSSAHIDSGNNVFLFPVALSMALS